MKLDRLIAVRNNKTVYRDGDRCVKVFYSDYTKADVLKEALNQARIEETGLNIPKILEVTTVDGKWAIVTQFIKGKTLTQLMEDHPEKRAEYLELLLDLQLQVNAQSCPLLNSLRERIDRRLMMSELDATTRFALHYRLADMPKNNKICHGDFRPSNIIMSEDGKPYILDWTHATRGNASADVARTYLLFLINGHREEAAAYIDHFCKKTNTEKAYFYRWVPIIAAALSVDSNESDREFLLSCVHNPKYK